MARKSSAQFAGSVHAPAAARRFAISALEAAASGARTTDLAHLDDVAVIVSELVTNAVRAGAGLIVVELSVEQHQVLVGVIDDGAGWPTMRRPEIDDTGGRGLHLIAALAEHWGVAAVQPTGKHVWATVPVAHAS
jgi:anti-sigma regulatory factor (Ser/Thr protein kinase)